MVELVRIFEGRILDVGPRAGSRCRSTGHPSKVDDFEELLPTLGIVELQRTGRVALPKLEREARRLHSVPLDMIGNDTQGSA